MTTQSSDPQTAKSKEPASLADKVTALNSFTESCPFAMLTTRVASTGQLMSRCMAVAAKESGGIDLLFFTNNTSGKTEDLASDAAVNVAFVDARGQWASFSGTAAVEADRAAIHTHYTPALRAWLGDLGDGVRDGGPDDPRIGAVRVRPKTITVSLFSRGIVGRAIEVARGAVTGETPGFTDIYELDEKELQQWREANKT